MPTLRNISPYGDLDFPLLGRVITAGETFELTAEQAKHVVYPSERFEEVPAPTKKKAD
jgi:hypothetical protein